MAAILAKVQRGEATQTDLETLLRRSHTVTDQNRCYLPVGSQLLVGSTVAAFVDEFVETVQRGAPTPATGPTPTRTRASSAWPRSATADPPASAHPDPHAPGGSAVRDR
jgi:hypothetical protein